MHREDAMRFTEADFDEMLHQLFDTDKPCYDALCAISECELLPAIKRWCAEDKALSGRNLEFDIMQDTQVRLMKYCITRFFLRGDRETPNDSPDEFCRWIRAVARNVTRDYSNKHREYIHVDFYELEERIGDDESDTDDSSDELRAVFDAVFKLRIGVHKLLAWLCVSVLILSETDSRSTATDMLVSRFGESTLDTLCDFFLDRIAKYPMLAPTDNTVRYLRASLDVTDGDGVRLGSRPFSHFFMNKGGKYSVSDWIHKINLSIKRSK